MDHWLTITQTARSVNITRQGVYVAIKSGRLKASKNESGQWFINPKDLSRYLQDKYSRLLSKKNDGSPLYDPEKGEYSVGQISEMSGCDRQRVYYLIRTKQLKSTRNNSSHIVHIDDASDMPRLIGSMYR